jgi:hypothetical protein
LQPQLHSSLRLESSPVAGATGLPRAPSRTLSLLLAATLPLVDMALRRASAAARLELSLLAAMKRRGATRGVRGAAVAVSGALGRASFRAGTGAAVLVTRGTESERVRLGAEEVSADLPALDKALRLASAKARPFILVALLCCAMTSPV